MGSIRKSTPKLAALVSLVFILQCCCCIVPLRWQVINEPSTASQEIAPVNAENCEEGSKIAAFQDVDLSGLAAAGASAESRSTGDQLLDEKLGCFSIRDLNDR